MTNKYKNKSRAIKQLIQNSDKGDFRSSFQLYRNYSEGKNVGQKDENLASQYLDKVESALIQKKLILSSMHLKDFRRFRELDISFDNKITVIIGKNGVGKTTIAEAIAKTLSWLNNNLEKTDVVGRPITENDINVHSEDFSEVAAKFKFDEHNTFDASIGNTVSGYGGRSPTDVVAIKQVAEMYKSTAKNTSIHIPLLAFYSVGRSNFTLSFNVKDEVSENAVNNRFSDLKTALGESEKLENFSQFYVGLFNKTKGRENKSLREVMEQLTMTQSRIEEIFQEAQEKGMPSGYWLSDVKEQLEELKQGEISLEKTESTRKHQRHLKLINQAIEKVVPEVANLNIDRSQGKTRLMVDNFGNRVNIAQLSHGQKMMVALSGDLARRLVALNPDSDDALKGHGIVVIDEIELHLHPRWQQEILITLQEAFPNLQFIVTTHSPQILSTVDKNCIRMLQFDDEGAATIETPEFQTKGVCSSDILEQIMGTFSIPEVEEAIWLEDYLGLIAENNWESEKGKFLFDKIVAHFGDEHPEVKKIIGEIRTQEFKRKVKALKRN